jgi:hypothetical protein
MSASSYKFILKVESHLTEHNVVHYGEMLFNYSDSVSVKGRTSLERACIMSYQYNHVGSIWISK